MQYKAILFDLDGTISDSKSGITKAVQYALKQFDINEPLESLEKFVGPPLQESFEQYYEFNSDTVNEAVTHYRTYFTEFGIYDNAPYEGVLEMLKKLHMTGTPLYIATSKPTVYARKILEKDLLAPYFKEIVGSELDGTRSQKREVIAYLMAIETLKAEEILMVGDRKHDLIGARDNQVDAVGVLYGYGDYEELSACESIQIVETVSALEAFLQSKIG
ncbi:HAD-IA family hydrolase [Fusibacter sp. 3D3]|uniref:HAD-IA family hydrolase n=1 Tax=Fusibacter sp. 3D3 TaxID=1048380 RepID=UPI00085381BB|nr:HAD-IA family hydrolase [Fusibacter sp. 3D3]GAU79141.1 phosphoglycolate phosphatase [Fusibacter sp. 3D3]